VTKFMINKDGATFYLNGNTWFRPAYGANGVFYTVVPTPWRGGGRSSKVRRHERWTSALARGDWPLRVDSSRPGTWKAAAQSPPRLARTPM